jgi:hypothetical protein
MFSQEDLVRFGSLRHFHYRTTTLPERIQEVFAYFAISINWARLGDISPDSV